jgi:hypothetical protein
LSWFQTVRISLILKRIPCLERRLHFACFARILKDFVPRFVTSSAREAGMRRGTCAGISPSW